MANSMEKYFTMKREVTNLFDELDEYLEFCKKQGYTYNEAHLYNDKTPWGELQRVKAGKFPKDNWSPYPKEVRPFNGQRPYNTNYRTR